MNSLFSDTTNGFEFSRLLEESGIVAARATKRMPVRYILYYSVLQWVCLLVGWFGDLMSDLSDGRMMSGKTDSGYVAGLKMMRLCSLNRSVTFQYR